MVRSMTNNPKGGEDGEIAQQADLRERNGDHRRIYRPRGGLLCGPEGAEEQHRDQATEENSGHHSENQEERRHRGEGEGPIAHRQGPRPCHAGHGAERQRRQQRQRPRAARSGPSGRGPGRAPVRKRQHQLRLETARSPFRRWVSTRTTRESSTWRGMRKSIPDQDTSRYSLSHQAIGRRLRASLGYSNSTKN